MSLFAVLFGVVLALLAPGCPSQAAINATQGPVCHGQLHRLEEAVDEAVFDNCFLAGTLVAMADGSKKPIEEVRAGDQVKAGDPETGEVSAREVVRTFRNVTDEVVDVTWAPLDRVECLPTGQRGRGERHSVGSSREGSEGGEDGEPPAAEGEQTVRCTPGHPWWLESQRCWRLAGDLRVGDLLKLESGQLGVVLALSVRKEEAATFNFEVRGLHTYFVAGRSTATAVLTHNASLSKIFRATRDRTRAAIRAAKRRSWDFGGYLDGVIPKPAEHMMEGAHAHHIAYKGRYRRSKAMREVLLEQREILEKHGINWYSDLANLIWAPNEKHSIANARRVLTALQKADIGLRRPNPTKIAAALQAAGREVFGGM